MADRGMVVKCYEFCLLENKCSTDCPYWDNKATADECTEELAKDVLTLLKEQEAEIRQLRLALDIAKGTCKGIKAGQ